MKILAREPGARVLAGGQSLINVLKLRLAVAEVLVDVSALHEMQKITVMPSGAVQIGAATTYRAMTESDDLRRAHPKVVEVAETLVDVQVRCRGTLGGNCCFNDPASNFPPLLVALGATMLAVGPAGRREIRAADFFVGHFRTALEPGEILESLTLPPLLSGAGVGYSSIQLAEDSWAVARAAAMVRCGEKIEEVRVVLGCVDRRPVRARESERRLLGSAPTTTAVREAAEAAEKGLRPPGDVHASSEYRSAMAIVAVEKALTEAVAGGRHVG